MNSLPELAGGRIHYRLPLTEEAAIRLIDVLLAESAQLGAERLEEVLACDAPLAVWAVLVAPESADAGLPLSSLVGWLAPRIGRFLASSAVIAVRAGSDAALHSNAASMAAEPHDMPETAGTTDRNRRFVGLVAGAVDWLMRYGTPLPDQSETLQSLPAWLRNSLKPVASLGTRPTDPRPHGQQTCQIASQEWAERLARLATHNVRFGELETSFTSAVEQEKLAALKAFAYGAGHEINNPLANISARAQTLLKDEHDPERRQKLAAINTQAFRAHEMIADLMLFAQPPEWKSDRVVISSLVAELESAWRRQAEEQQTVLSVRIADESLAAWADRGALAVALRALVVNALEAVGRGGNIEVAVTPARLTKDTTADDRAGDGSPTIGIVPSTAAPDAVAICVRDDGPGIDAAVRPRIFDPFFSGREAGRGLGFGLPKCWRIVTALGGRIDVVSGPAAGAAFTLVLPLAPRAN